MSAKDLDNQEMISISVSWLDSKFGMFVGDHAPLKVLHPRLNQAHNQLVELDKRGRDLERQERELTEKISLQNKAFDQLVSGVYWALVAGSFLAPDSQAAKMYEEVSLAILPDGRGVTKNSFRNQAGAAIYSQERLTQEYIEFLKKIVFEGRTLYDDVESMLEVAKQLGDSLESRAQLVAISNSAGRKKEERDAREDWIKVATDILAMSVILEMSDDDVIRLRANYDDAEAAAVRRRKLKAANQKKKDEANKNKAKTPTDTPTVPNETDKNENPTPETNGETTGDDQPILPESPPAPKLIETDSPVEN